MLLILGFLACFGVESGLLSSEIENSLIPIFSIGCMIKINETFLIHESLNYWEKGYEEKEGTYSKKYKFSKLGLSETALFKLNTRKVIFKAGTGISLNLLKNYIEESSCSGSWRITEYYTLNSVVPGVHIALLIGIPFQKFSLFLKIRRELILTGELESPFYTNSDIGETVYTIGMYF